MITLFIVLFILSQIATSYLSGSVLIHCVCPCVCLFVVYISCFICYPLLACVFFVCNLCNFCVVLTKGG